MRIRISTFLIVALFMFAGFDFGRTVTSLEPVRRPSSTANEFLAAGLEIPQALQAQGHAQFGNFNLDALISQMYSVRIVFSKDYAIAKKNQNGRISARWEVSGKGRVIHVYTPSWQRFVEQRPVLALHEYLGILGYPDENYWLSTQMWTLSLSESKALNDDERSRIARAIEIQAARRQEHASNGGGVVGVGGGGEGATVWMRQRVIRESLNDLNNGEGHRPDAVLRVYDSLLSTDEASYGGFYSKATVRAARAKAATYKPYCLIGNSLCKTKVADARSGTCKCPKSDQLGTLVYTANPW